MAVLGMTWSETPKTSFLVMRPFGLIEKNPDFSHAKLEGVDQIAHTMLLLLSSKM